MQIAFGEFAKYIGKSVNKGWFLQISIIDSSHLVSKECQNGENEGLIYICSFLKDCCF